MCVIWSINAKLFYKWIIEENLNNQLAKTLSMLDDRLLNSAVKNDQWASK